MTVRRPETAGRPLISFVISVYAVEEYLPDFLQSLQGLDVDRADLELIFVIDGSPDNSETVIRQWLTVNAFAAAVVTKSNGGLNSARNAGLARARGRWVSFPDPDESSTRNTCTMSSTSSTVRKANQSPWSPAE